MQMEKGSLSIESENMFPIIKKWLYSDHDIFVRELVSNGCDAITKLKKLEVMGEYDFPEDYKASIQVDVLINNAGFGMVGAAHTLDMEKEEQMLQLLVVTPTQLCKCCLRDMYKRGSGKILNVASVGAFQPGPYTASYYASKSYLYQYSQAIRLEAKKQGVQVCTLCPGSTRTHFFEKTGAKTPIWAMSPERVAKEAWEGLNADKAVVVPGMINRLLRLVPAQIKAYGVALLKKHT